MVTNVVLKYTKKLQEPFITKTITKNHNRIARKTTTSMVLKNTTQLECTFTKNITTTATTKTKIQLQ